MKEFTKNKNSAFILFTTVYICLIILSMVVIFKIITDNKHKSFKINKQAGNTEFEVRLAEEILRPELNEIVENVILNNDSKYIDENQFLKNSNSLSRGGYKLNESVFKSKNIYEEIEKILSRRAEINLSFYKKIIFDNRQYRIFVETVYKNASSKKPEDLIFKKIREIRISSYEEEA